MGIAGAAAAEQQLPTLAVAKQPQHLSWQAWQWPWQATYQHVTWRWQEQAWQWPWQAACRMAMGLAIAADAAEQHLHQFGNCSCTSNIWQEQPG